MKSNILTSFLILLLAMSILGCGRKMIDDQSNLKTDDVKKVLHDQIMDIYNEVMPMTEEISNISKHLKASLADASTDLEKELLQEEIDYLDSVNTLMTDWKQEFK